MQRSLLAAFRSADGRSLARALAALIVVSTVFGGLAAGNAAGTAPDHCIATPFGDPGRPAAHDGMTCCPGMMGATPALPPPADIRLGRELPPVAVRLPGPTETWIPKTRIAPGDRPRGPPASV